MRPQKAVEGEYEDEEIHVTMPNVICAADSDSEEEEQEEEEEEEDDSE